MKIKVSDVVRHLLLAFLSFVWLIPIVWLVATSFSSYTGMNTTTFFPQEWGITNYVNLLFGADTVAQFPKWFWNTFIIAVFTCIISTAFVLMVLKVVLSGLLFGGVNAMMYAFAGGLLSMVCMALLSRVRGVHPIMVSMVGGVAHNVGQVALAMVILSTPSLMYYMAVLMAVGLGTGAVTGVAANLVMKHLKKIKW